LANPVPVLLLALAIRVAFLLIERRITLFLKLMPILLFAVVLV
jgi:hypothetical protein